MIVCVRVCVCLTLVMYSWGDRLKVGKSSVSVPPRAAKPRICAHTHTESDLFIVFLVHLKHFRLHINTHLRFVEQAELPFDLQEDRVEGELIGLLVQTRQTGTGVGQEARVPCAFFL